MATAYITEFSDVVRGEFGAIPIPRWPALAKQTVAIGAEAKSAAFNDGTLMIRVHVDAICSVEVSDAPTATTAMTRMAANQTEYFGVKPGAKLSVISNS